MNYICSWTFLKGQISTQSYKNFRSEVYQVYKLNKSFSFGMLDSPAAGEEVWPEVERAECLARGAALKWASGVFCRPEHLERLAHYRKRESQRTASINSRLKVQLILFFATFICVHMILSIIAHCCHIETIYQLSIYISLTNPSNKKNQNKTYFIFFMMPAEQLPTYSYRVPGSILSSSKCLHRGLHVLSVSMWGFLQVLWLPSDLPNTQL